MHRCFRICLRSSPGNLVVVDVGCKGILMKSRYAVADLGIVSGLWPVVIQVRTVTIHRPRHQINVPSGAAFSSRACGRFLKRCQGRIKPQDNKPDSHRRSSWRVDGINCIPYINGYEDSSARYKYSPLHPSLFQSRLELKLPSRRYYCM